MSKIRTHISRNRHGTFGFRLYIPKDLQDYIQKSEIRISLRTQERSRATISALRILSETPRFYAELRQMAEEEKKRSVAIDFMVLWLEEIQKAAVLEQIVKQQQEQIVSMITKEKARQFGELMHERGFERGELRGKKELEDKLMFPPSPERTPKFSELRDAYLKSLQENRAEGGAKKPPTSKTMAEYKAALDLFITVMGDQNIGSIDEERVGAFFAILKKLPANMGKLALYRGKSISEILKMEPPPQNGATASQKMERISAMFKWATDSKRRRKWGIEANLFEGYGLSKGESQERTRRPLTNEELKKLFSHPDFVSKRFGNSYAFWLIPLALFTGARLGELCQLELKDFIEIDGIPCIDINDESVDEESRKRVKTRNAKRLVPIHSELLRIGIMRHVENMRKQGHTRLFPELNAQRRDGPGHAASNWFGRFREKVDVTKDGAAFHSLRHNFITTVLDSGISEHMVAPVVGHEAQLVTGKVYWNKRDVHARKPTIEACKLPEDILGMIPAVEEITFTKARGRKTGG